MKKDVESVYNAAKNNDFDTVAGILLDEENEIIAPVFYDLFYSLYQSFFLYSRLPKKIKNSIFDECLKTTSYSPGDKYCWNNTKEVNIKAFEFFYSRIEQFDENIKSKIYENTLRNFVSYYDDNIKNVYSRAGEIQRSIEDVDDIEKITILYNNHHYKDAYKILLNDANSLKLSFYKDIIQFFIEGVTLTSKELDEHPYDPAYNFVNDFCSKFKLLLTKEISSEKSDYYFDFANKVCNYDFKRTEDFQFIKNSFLCVFDELSKNDVILILRNLIEAADSINDGSLYLNMIHTSIIYAFVSKNFSYFEQIISVEYYKKFDSQFENNEDSSNEDPEFETMFEQVINELGWNNR